MLLSYRNFIQEDIVQWIIIINGFCSGGGYCPGGEYFLGNFVSGHYVLGSLVQRDFVLGGYCPGRIISYREYALSDIVLIRGQAIAVLIQ